MKKIYFIILALIGMVFYSCQKNEITFPYSEIDANAYSEVRIINAMPISGNTDTLLINGENYSSVTTVLGSYYPLSAPKYFEVPVGTATISLNYMASTTPTVNAFTYSGNMTLLKGKWTAYIYDATKDPILLQDPDNVPQTDAWTDTVCFIKFSNFFCKADSTPYGPLTLKAKKNVTGATWETVASNIDFGQQSSYYLYKLTNNLNAVPWSGSEAKVSFALFDSNGVQFQQFSSSSTSAKSDYTNSGWTLGKGRAYVFYLNGKEGTNNKTDQFIRLGYFNPL